MSKTLRAIPDQALVMMDANIVIYALFPQGRYYQMGKSLLQRGARSEVQLYLAVNTVASTAIS